MGSAVTRRGGLFAFYSLAQPAVYKRKTGEILSSVAERYLVGCVVNRVSLI